MCSVCGTDTWQIHHCYSDFESLHTDLQREQSEQQPSKTRLPPLPPKRLLGSSLDAEFVRDRQQQLESYLNKLAAEHALHSSPALTAFLQRPNADPLVTLQEQVNSLRASNVQLTQQMRHMQHMLHTLTLATPSPHAAVSPTAHSPVNGHPPTSPSPPLDVIMRELSRLKRKVRTLESFPPFTRRTQPSATAALSDESDTPSTGVSVSSIGRSQSLQTNFRARGGEEDSEEDEDRYGRHASSMSRTDRARSISQRIATREKRRAKRTMPTVLTAEEEEEVEEERGRSLSESHVTDRLAMRHFHYKTLTPYRHNPFMQKPTGAAVSSIKEEDASPQQPVGGVVGRGRYSDPAASYYKAFAPGSAANGRTDGSIGAAFAGSSSFFASFGPTIQQQPFHRPPERSGIGNLLHKQQQQQQQQQVSKPQSTTQFSASQSQPVPQRTNHSTQTIAPADGYDSSHSDVQLSSSPSTSLMAAISEGVANAVLDSTPNASPINSPVYPSGREPNAGASSDGEGSSGSRKRTSLLQKLPPPQLKLGHASAPAGAMQKLASSQPLAPAAQLSLSQTSPTHRGQTSNEEKVQQATHQASTAVVSPRHSRPSAPSTPTSANTVSVTSLSSLLAFTPQSAPLWSLTSSATLSLLAPTAPIPFSSLDAFYHACLDVELDARMTDMVLFIAPSPASEHRYTATYHFVDSLIRRTIGAEVYAHGSFALKTYLPDADLDVSAFFSKTNEDSWIQRIVTALVALSQEGHAGPTAPVGGGGKDRERSGRDRDRDRERQREKVEAERDTAHAASALSPSAGRYPVKSVTFISAETSVIKCQIGHISVDISGNATTSLSTLALFEQVDQLVGCSHLFKRTILLATTYFKNELLISGSHAGFLSSYCIRTFVLYIFNAYRDDIRSPLQGLYRLMWYLQHFDWTEHAFGLFGPVRLSHLPSFLVVTDHPCSWPAHTQPLVTQQLLQAYSVMTAAGGGGDRAFSAKYLNVIDPANPYNNLGRSVSYQNVGMIRQAMVEGALRLRLALEGWVGRVRLEARLSGSFAPTARSGGTTDEGSVSSSAPNSESALSNSSSPLTPGIDDDIEQLQVDEDQKEAYHIVSLLFERTLQAYSGRYTFSLRPRALKKVRPAALPILGSDGQPVVVGDKASASASAAASRTSSPHPLTPSLPSTPTSPLVASSTALLVSDSELDTEADSEAEDTAARSRTARNKYTMASRNNTTSATTSQLASAHSQSAWSSAPAAQPYSVLDGNLPSILDNLNHAKQFDTPDVTEHELVTMITKILLQCGSVPVGKLGSLLHNVMNNHSLPSMLKEKFGGLKRFLERHGGEFTIGVDHPFNPHVHLTSELMAREREREAGMGVGGAGGAGVENGGAAGGGGMASGMGLVQQQRGVSAALFIDGAGGADGGRPARQQHNRGSNRQATQSAGLQSHQQSQPQQLQSQQTRQPAQVKGTTSSAGWSVGVSAGMRGQQQQQGGSMASALQALASPTHPATAANDQHTAALTRPHQRLTHSSAGVTQPLFARPPHPRMVSSEGLNVTAPAFIPTPATMDGSGYGGGFEHGGDGGGDMDGQYGETEFGRGGSGGVINGQTHTAYQQRYSK